MDPGIMFSIDFSVELSRSVCVEHVFSDPIDVFNFLDFSRLDLKTCYNVGPPSDVSCSINPMKTIVICVP